MGTRKQSPEQGKLPGKKVEGGVSRHCEVNDRNFLGR